MASGYDKSTAPPEMFGEPDDEECPHGVPVGLGYECWECRYEHLERQYITLEDEALDLEGQADRLAVVADALAVELSEWEFDRTDADWAAEQMAEMREEIERQDTKLANMVTERDEMLELILDALKLVKFSPRYPEMAGKADRWLKEG